VPLESINHSQQQTIALYELTRELGASLDLDHTFQSLCSRLKRLVPYDAVVIWAQRGDRVAPLHVSGEASSRWANAALTPGRGVSGWVLTSKQTLVNGDMVLEGASALPSSAAPAEGWVLAFPLAQGEFQGVLSLYRGPANPFSSEESRLLAVIAPKLAAAVENGMRYQTAETTASTDYLTGLANAAALYRHLAGEIELTRALDSTLAVVVCDLDGFKPLNDRFGHLAGNQALREIGALLRGSCRDYDFAARIGGDEFVLVFAGMKPADLHARLASLRESIVNTGQSLFHEPILNVSFGAAFFPEDGTMAEALLEEADRRMYGDKQIRKAGVDSRPNLVMFPKRRSVGA
jgi:diguanylate cyclase (GGDEF)-like protein